MNCTFETFSQFKNYNYDNFKNVDSFIAVPSIYIAEAKLKIPKYIKIAAQDISIYYNGAHTGEISGHMLAENNIKYVIIGHSERRIFFKETNQIVNKKLKNALNSKIIPVVCFGETESYRNDKTYLNFLHKQFFESLEGVKNERIEIAYEPVWAIGTGKVADASLIEEVVSKIKSWSDELHLNSRIIYGGSVAYSNINDIKKIDKVDGVLVGGASLTPEFEDIAFEMGI